MRETVAYTAASRPRLHPLCDADWNGMVNATDGSVYNAKWVGGTSTYTTRLNTAATASGSSSRTSSYRLSLAASA